MARPRKAATAFLKLCPFSGKSLVLAKLSNGLLQLRGEGWVCTKLFQTEQQAWHWASHRDGVAPEFSSAPAVVTSEAIEAAPDPTEDLIPDVLKRAQ